MRKQAAAVTSTRTSLPAGHRKSAPTELVCVALVLALAALAARIASIW